MPFFTCNCMVLPIVSVWNTQYFYCLSCNHSYFLPYAALIGTKTYYRFCFTKHLDYTVNSRNISPRWANRYIQTNEQTYNRKLCSSQQKEHNPVASQKLTGLYLSNHFLGLKVLTCLSEIVMLAIFINKMLNYVTSFISINLDLLV